MMTQRYRVPSANITVSWDVDNQSIRVHQETLGMNDYIDLSAGELEELLRILVAASTCCRAAAKPELCSA